MIVVPVILPESTAQKFLTLSNYYPKVRGFAWNPADHCKNNSLGYSPLLLDIDFIYNWHYFLEDIGALGDPCSGYLLGNSQISNSMKDR